jgi:Na+-driven multidrug efflux pump
LLLVFVLISILAASGVATIAPVFRALGASPEVLELIEGYLRVYYPGTLLFTLTMIGGSVMRATGDARVPGYIMTGAALLNLALDPFFIFGWAGVPRLELTGAAVAMLVSRVLAVVVLLYFLAFREKLLLPIGTWFTGLLGSWREIMRIGVPAIATQLIGPVSAAVVTRLLASHGEMVVAGFGVATRIESVAVMIFFALSGSIGPFVGQNFGAAAYHRVWEGMRLVYYFCLGWGALGFITLLLVGAPAAALIDGNAEVVAVAALYLTIVPASHGGWGVLMMVSAAFNSLGKPMPATVLSFARMFLIYIPLALAGNALWGWVGIFAATTVTNLVMGGAGYLWFKRSAIVREA